MLGIGTIIRSWHPGDTGRLGELPRPTHPMTQSRYGNGNLIRRHTIIRANVSCGCSEAFRLNHRVCPDMNKLDVI